MIIEKKGKAVRKKVKNKRSKQGGTDKGEENKFLKNAYEKEERCHGGTTKRKERDENKINYSLFFTSQSHHPRS